MIKEIILCESCQGKGIKEVPDNHGTYDLVECKSCLGSGRLIKETIIKIRPFENDKNNNH